MNSIIEKKKKVHDESQSKGVQRCWGYIKEKRELEIVPTSQI